MKVLLHTWNAGESLLSRYAYVAEHLRATGLVDARGKVKDELRRARDTCQAFVRPDDDNCQDYMLRRLNYVRRFFSRFLSTIELEASADGSSILDAIGALLDWAPRSAAPNDLPFIDELRFLYTVAEKLEAQRGKSEPPDKVEFLFYVENEQIRIVPRKRGPIDKIVAELMIHVNSSWGRLLGDRDVRALYRTQEGGKVRLSLYPAPHQSLGVPQYLWASSPLRRYADLLNQWQLLSVLYDEPSPYAGRDEAIMTVLRDFESAHSAYDEFQRTMERYYSLRYLVQEGLDKAPVTGVVVRDNLVRLERVPLFQRVPSLPECPPGAVVSLVLSHLDDLELTLHCEFRERIT